MKTKLQVLGALLALLCATAQAQISITTNTVAPSIGADDVYYLPGPVDEATGAMTTTGNDNTASSDNDTFTYVAVNRTSKGQSFTTGSNPNGYLIRSVTVQRVRWSSFLDNGTYMNIASASSYPFRFGSISGTSLTPTVTTNAVYSGSAISGFTSGDLDLYLTFDMSKLGLGTLSPNSTYFFEVASPTSFFEMHNTRTNTLYAGGDAFHGDNNGALDADDTVTAVDGDFAFHVKLLPGGGPTVTAVAVPSSALGGQSFTVTATAAAGSGGAVTGVTIDLSSLGGSASAVLVAAGGDTYTNTFTVSGGAPVGATSLEVTATDASALLGFYNFAFTVLPADMVWNGGSGADDKWSSGPNWVGNSAPALTGSAVTFAGTTRLTPDMDANYSLTALVFSNTAGSFIISSSMAGKLTNGSGGVINNSTSAQTLNVPVVLNVGQVFDAAAGNIVLSNSLTANAAFGKAGAGALVFAGAVTNSLGNTMITNGLVRVANGVVNLVETSGALTKIDKGAGVEVAGGTLNISGAGGWFPVGDSANTTNTLTVSGGTVNVLNQYGIQVPRIGHGVLTLTAGNMIVNDTGGLGLSIGDNGAAQTGTVNLNGGKLVANRIVSYVGANKFYFNGGTLSPVASRTDFMNNAGTLSVEVRDGGATIDTAGFDITMGEPLLHSTVGGDNATDGGLTKTGNGTLMMETDASGYNGPTRVLGGSLSVNVNYTGVASTGDLIVSNAVFAFNDIYGASWAPNNIILTNGGTLSLTNQPGVPGVSGAGNLTLAGSTIRVYVPSAPSAAPVTVAGTLSASGANVISLTGAGLTSGSSFPVIDYTGSAVPTNGFTLVLPPGSNGYLSNNVANTSLDVVITASGQNLSWHGANADNSVLLPDWNINASENWYDAVSNPAKYLQYSGNSYGDNVTFGNLGYNLTGTNEVNLPVRVVPSAVVINSTVPYTLSGPGGIDGATSLVKMNTGYVLIGTSNNFTGGTLLNAGTLAITNDTALGTNSAPLTIAGGILQFAGNVNSTRPVGLTAATTFETLAGVNARLAGVITNLAVNLTNMGSGTLSIASGINNNLNNLIVNGGTLKITNGTVNVTGTSGGSLVDKSGTLEVATGGVLTLGSGVSFYSIGNSAGAASTFIVNGGSVTNNSANGTVVARVGSGTLTVNSGTFTDTSSTARGIDIADTTTSSGGTVNLNGGTLVTKYIRSPQGTGNSGVRPSFLYFNGGVLMAGAANTAFLSATTAKLSSQVRANGGTIDNGGFNITIGDPLLHNTDTATDGGLVLQGIGTTLLNGLNTYNGPTLVNAGTLAGTGTIAGTLTNNARLYPGSGGIGNLTVNGAIRLNASSTNFFIVNGTTGLASNTLTAGSTLVYGGVLSIATNGAFALNQQIQLFKGNGTTNTSSFAGILGNPGAGLAFSFTNGWLKVVQGGPSGPAALTNSYSAGVLSLSWPAGQNWRLQMQTNSLSTGLGTNWTYLTDGSVSSTNINVNPAQPAVFYRLTYP